MKTPVNFPTALQVYCFEDVIQYCEERGCDEQTLEDIRDLIIDWAGVEMCTLASYNCGKDTTFELLLNLGFKEPIYIWIDE